LLCHASRIFHRRMAHAFHSLTKAISAKAMDDTGGGGDDDMMMQMSFYNGIKISAVLFDWWSTETPAQYIATLAVVFIFAMFTVWLGVSARRYSNGVTATFGRVSETTPLLSSGISGAPATPRTVSRSRRLKLKTYSAILYAFSLAGNYLLMLLVMTFNTGIFAAVILGAASAFFLFGMQDGAFQSEEHCSA